MVTIRSATEQDWPAIYRFFKPIVDEGTTYCLPESWSSDQAGEYWLAPAPGHTVVALDEDGAIVGSAKMGPNRPARGSHVATASFMVDSIVAGRGIGRAMGTYVIAWARENDYRGIQFNAVVETNVAAVRLWQSLGFDIIGTIPGAFNHAEYGFVGLHVMHLNLLPNRD